ncbi:MAG: S8 family serine peptidase [Salinivirgaceae bacterium]|jgi:subtilisin family serine protease
MIRIAAVLFIVFLVITSFDVADARGNKQKGTTLDSLNIHYLNWYNLDPKSDKVQGVSVDKAYQELLVGKTPKKKIIVAVIDGGVDITHEDLKDKIWVNTDEIPNNQMDDDHNGYVDDINGWNFLGNASGENLDIENFEFVRVINKYKSLYDTITTIQNLTKEDRENYTQYQHCLKRYNDEIEEITSQLEELNEFRTKLDSALVLLSPYTKNKEPKLDEIEKVEPKNKQEADAKKLLKYILKRGFTYKMLDYETIELNKELNTSLNIELNGRIIVGDDCYNPNEKNYGNNDVTGPSAEHGSFVSGIIAANRNNNKGINGIADNVEIMVLRAVPDSDEYDKDVVLSIRYAVDNGANIINMSFGKEFSPLKNLVDDAILYAESHGVLLIHASGNEAANCDTVESYPTKRLNDNSLVKNWITVGANAKIGNKTLPGVFSNYGQKTVDVFAPGVDIISLFPGSKYDLESGTSFSSPVTSGVAALVWSYYPELTAVELKDILLASALKNSKKVYRPNITTYKKTKVRFATLSVTGGIINAYEALKLAESRTK